MPRPRPRMHSCRAGSPVLGVSGAARARGYGERKDRHPGYLRTLSPARPARLHGARSGGRALNVKQTQTDVTQDGGPPSRVESPLKSKTREQPRRRYSRTGRHRRGAVRQRACVQGLQEKRGHSGRCAGLRAARVQAGGASVHPHRCGNSSPGPLLPGGEDSGLGGRIKRPHDRRFPSVGTTPSRPQRLAVPVGTGRKRGSVSQTEAGRGEPHDSCSSILVARQEAQTTLPTAQSDSLASPTSTSRKPSLLHTLGLLAPLPTHTHCQAHPTSQGLDFHQEDKSDRLIIRGKESTLFAPQGQVHPASLHLWGKDSQPLNLPRVGREQHEESTVSGLFLRVGQLFWPRRQSPTARREARVRGLTPLPREVEGAELGAMRSSSSFSRTCVQCTSAWISRGSAALRACGSLWLRAAAVPSSRRAGGERSEEGAMTGRKKMEMNSHGREGGGEETPQERKQREKLSRCQTESERGRCRDRAAGRTHAAPMLLRDALSRFTLAVDSHEEAWPAHRETPGHVRKGAPDPALGRPHRADPRPPRFWESNRATRVRRDGHCPSATTSNSHRTEVPIPGASGPHRVGPWQGCSHGGGGDGGPAVGSRAPSRTFPKL